MLRSAYVNITETSLFLVGKYTNHLYKHHCCSHVGAEYDSSRINA